MAKAANGSAVVVKTTATGYEIDGGNGVDVITADNYFTGSDPTKTYTIVSGNGDDTVWGSARNEIIWGDSPGNSGNTSDNGADQLHGGGGKDEIHGGNGDDKLWGDDGNDKLFGDNGADQLTGGLGGDEQTGGKGGDKFIYLVTTDSTANPNGTWNETFGDWIKDFNHSEGDKLDFSGFHDITGTGHPDELTWNGSTGGAYKIWSAGGFVYADTNGDGVADLAIKVDGTVGGNDFIGINHAPVALNDLGTTDEDHSVVLTSLANDTDPDGDALTITNASIGTGLGSATITNSGHSITYDPGSSYHYLAVGESEQVTINYTISDGHGGTANAVETVTVAGVNDVTIAVADTGSMGENEIKSFDVIANDTLDADHTAANTISLNGAADITGPVILGTPNITIDGNQVKVDPGTAFDALADGEHATITVHYTLTGDATDTSNANLTIDVVGANDVAIAIADIGSMGENEIKSFDVIANDTLDADHTAANTISLNGAADITGPVILGTPNITIDGNQVKVDPGTAFDALADGEHATITVHYTLTGDATDTSNADLTIDVVGANDVAIAVADTGSMGENEIKSFDVIANDTLDADHTAANTISLNGAADITGPAILGTPNITIDGNQVKVDPGTAFDALADGEHATITVHYTLTGDAADTSNADLTIDVVGANDDASISGTATGDVTEDNPATASGTLSVADADHNENTFLASDGGSHAGLNNYGTFAFDTSTGGWTYTLDSGNATVNALNDGGILHDTYIVHSLDGTDDQIIDVTIHGHTDAAGGGGPPSGPTIASPFTGTGDPNDFDNLGLAGHQTNPANPNDPAEIFYGGADDDTINGTKSGDTYYGGSGNDTISAKDGADTVYGGSGADGIDGNGDVDMIIGGYGADTLIGGSAVDTFKYLDKLDTGDTINQFIAGPGGDKLDFSLLNPTNGNPDLANAAGSFGLFADTAVHANSINYFQSGADTKVWVDTDGVTTTVEMEIVLVGVTATDLTNSNFVL